MPKMTIVGLTGSLREGSFTRQMMETLPELAPEGMTIDLVGIDHLPFYNADLREDGHGPAVVQEFAAKIANADGLIVGSPEYNRSPPAVIKNAIDWVSVEPGKPLDGKPTLIATQSPGQLGGILSNYHLRQVLSTTGAVFLTGPEVAITRMGDKVSDGRVSDADTRDFLASNLKRLAELIEGHS
ncbi:NADPH-dependent FMN reductase [Pseudooceanicola sp. MF1-13]|uniref:NADPH-dependent FMN reductase n=1 Tax=Pseudooceanicola sp. MF1-13 TaxID=3379095 RepID=UPI0038922AEA